MWGVTVTKAESQDFRTSLTWHQLTTNSLPEILLYFPDCNLYLICPTVTPGKKTDLMFPLHFHSVQFLSLLPGSSWAAPCKTIILFCGGFILIRNKMIFAIVLVTSTEADLEERRALYFLRSSQSTALQGRQNAYPEGVYWQHLVPWSSFSFSPLWLELEVHISSSCPYS